MIRYFSTKLLIPLVLLTVVALSIHRYWSAGGFFINLATTFIGILLSVFYVGRVQDTYKEIKWLRVLLITLFDRILLTIGGRQRQSIAPA